ncbi:MAG: retron Ec67 family RNA-directed DNA polymerase/endonuclease [Proteobacteria bacterium]|nr:retron Ec67 family RNA-directed DNA polymerase/endonuclease [Pseudomonadota bacterium]
MSTLQKLKNARTRSDLAKILGVTPSGLTYALFVIPQEAKYHKFQIPKRSGGHREISAPNSHIKLVQRRLASKLYECTKEIENAQPNRKKVTHGFQPGRSIITNADRHKNRRYVFNVDVKDFFDSINFGRVRGFFNKDREFLLDKEICTAIAQIACWENSLPQGSPCSPVISNLIGHILDVKMLKLAKESKCRYTRYADDMTFSTNEREFPSSIAIRDAQDPGKWSVSTKLEGLIKQAGFEINPQKTRMQIVGSRQLATGLVVNKKVNIKEEYCRQTRAMCNHLFKKDAYFLQNTKEGEAPKLIKNLDILEGKLCHIHAVKTRVDLTDQQKKSRKFDPPPGTLRLYKKFLFYKNFFAQERPLIITEGASDIIYLRTAIRHSKKKFPLLFDKTLQIRFLKNSKTVKEVLGLGDGCGGIGKLVATYAKEISAFGRPSAFPIIILIDNDDGSKKSIFKVAKDAAKATLKKDIEISIESNDCWHHLGDNLYLVKVPHGGSKSPKSIEELFPEKWLKFSVDGKIFDPSKKHGDHTSLGKVAFAKKVVETHAGEIDFGGFDSLFSLIEGAIADYRKN